jgi:cytochrome P450
MSQTTELPVTSPPIRRLPTTPLRTSITGMATFRRDQVRFVETAVRDYGDIFRIWLLGLPVVMVNHPAYVQRILLDNHANYDKDNLLYRLTRPVFRSGIVTSIGGEPWRRQRRLMQPCFHRPNVVGFATYMSEETDRMLRRWRETATPGEPIEICGDMGHLALRIVTRTLFGADIGPSTTALEADFTDINRIFGDFFRFPFPPMSVPTPAHRRLRQLVRNIDAFIARLVEERARQDTQHDDLFSILAAAVDEETGEAMSPVQLQHEVLNIMVGGYETTTYSLAWLLYLVASHPEVQQQLHDEVDSVLAGRTPTAEDLRSLPYARQVVDETLRVSPAAWQTMRHAVDDDVIGGYRVPAGSSVYVNLLTFHRHPEYWPDPTRFDPDRFRPELVAQRPRNAYIPFGIGPRACLGKSFAITELHIVLAMVAQRCHLSIPAGRPPVEMQPLISLRPKDGVQLLVTAR